jgi:hypothetical protein
MPETDENGAAQAHWDEACARWDDAVGAAYNEEADEYDIEALQAAAETRWEVVKSMGHDVARSFLVDNVSDGDYVFFGALPSELYFIGPIHADGPNEFKLEALLAEYNLVLDSEAGPAVPADGIGSFDAHGNFYDDDDDDE